MTSPSQNSLVKPFKSLRKCIDESPSIAKTVHVPVTIEVETSQSTHSLSLSAIDRFTKRSQSPCRSNSPHEFPLPEEEDVIDSDLDPEESALAAARDLKRKGWDPSASFDVNPKTFKSRAESIERSSNLSLGSI